MKKTAILISLLWISHSLALTIPVNPGANVSTAIASAMPGDTVLLKNGVHKIRRLDINKAGTNQKPLVVRGETVGKTMVDFGLHVANWTDNGNGTYTGMPDYPEGSGKASPLWSIVIGSKPHAWVYDSGVAWKQGTGRLETDGRITVWPWSNLDPRTDTTYIVFAYANFEPGIHVGASNVRIENMSLRAGHTAVHAGDWNCWNAPQGSKGIPNLSDLVLRDLDIKFQFQYALRFDTWQKALIERMDASDGGLINYPRSESGRGWPHSIIGWDAHDVEIRDSKIHDNHGEGVGPYFWCSNWRILRNEVFDNWSVNVYVDTDSSDVLVEGNFIYNTGKYGVTERNNSDGIRIANEYADYGGTDNTPEVTQVRILNNVIVGTGGGISAYAYGTGGALGRFWLKGALIAHNTIVNIPAGTNAIWIQGSTDTLQNNLLANCPNPFWLVQKNGSIDTVHNLISNSPKFVGGNLFSIGSWRLAGASIAIDKGTALSAIVNDYDSNPRVSGVLPDIGAFEYSATVNLYPINLQKHQRTLLPRNWNLLGQIRIQ